MKAGAVNRLHISWHIAWACAGLLLGVAATAIWELALVPHALVIVAVMTLAIAFRRRTRAVILLSLVGGFLLGAWRGSIEQVALQDYRPYYGQTALAQGRVVEDVNFVRDESRLRLAGVTINGQPLPGEIWVSTETKQEIKRSDILTVHGEVGEGFGNLPADMARATFVRLERPEHNDMALQVRDWFAGGIRTAIPEPQASLGSGFLVGQRSTLPQELDEQLKVAGLTHIVVASGYNLTILVGAARRSLLKQSKYLATMAAILMVCSFVLVTGFSPSMTRAGLVTLMSLAAWYYGRTVHPLVLLPLAAALTVIVNPAYVWGDLGWYLSFGSFAGVLLLAPLIHKYFWGSGGEPGVMRQILIETSSAQLATMPIILYSFGQFSTYALVANMLILPFIPLTMMLTFIAGIAGLAVPALAQWIGLPANAIMHFMISAVQQIASWPSSQLDITFNLVLLITSYAAMTAAIIYMWQRTGHKFRSDNIIGEKL